MSFLQWSNPGRSTIPGQLLCSRVINQHVMDSNIFVYFYLVTVFCLFVFFLGVVLLSWIWGFIFALGFCLHSEK